MPALGDKHIGRLDVAMDDAFRMRRVQSVSNLSGEVEQFAGLEGAAGDALSERLAFEQFHRNEGLVLELVDVVYGADARMIESGGRLRLAPEPLQGVPVAVDTASGRNFSATGRFSLVSSAL